ncbi:MAG: type II secretion system protein GspC [Pseudomonadota bacterium]
MTASALPALPPALAAVLTRATALYRLHGAKLPPIAALLLVAVLAWQAASLLWMVVPMPASAAWTPAPGFVDPTPARPALNVDALAGAHVFGQYQATASTASLANAPDTQLAFTLLGILAGTRDQESLALIAKDANDEAPYSIGDDVSPGVSLQAIFPDRVILSRNGKLETLRLDKDSPSNAQVFSAAPSSGEVQEGTPAAAQMISQIKEQVLTDPSKAANFIRVQPISGEGGLKGYRVYPGPERAAFNAAGLKPGDVVTAINGTSLSEPGQALQLLQSLSQASSMSLTVDRNGVSQSVNVSASP